MIVDKTFLKLQKRTFPSSVIVNFVYDMSLWNVKAWLFNWVWILQFSTFSDKWIASCVIMDYIFTPAILKMRIFSVEEMLDLLKYCKKVASMIPILVWKSRSHQSVVASWAHQRAPPTTEKPCKYESCWKITPTRWDVLIFWRS